MPRVVLPRPPEEAEGEDEGVDVTVVGRLAVVPVVPAPTVVLPVGPAPTFWAQRLPEAKPAAKNNAARFIAAPFRNVTSVSQKSSVGQSEPFPFRMA